MFPLVDLARGAVKKVRGRYRGPTWDWPAGSVTRLSYDMRERALNGVALGAALDRLAPFGPAAWFIRWSSSVNLYYYRLGLMVTVSDGRFDSFEVVLDPPNCADHAWHPFSAGRIAIRNLAGNWVDLTRAAPDAEVVAAFGPSLERGEFEEERWADYQPPGHLITTTFHTGIGRLVKLEIDAGEDLPVVS